MKTLKIIQTLAKIGKILSRIAFIFCIVGICGCIIGIVSLALGAETFRLGGVTIQSIIERNADMDLPSMYTAMAVGMVFCAAVAVVSRSAEIYFKNELADGTPFTLRGANELLRLGILTVAVPMAAAIVCSIGIGIADNVYPGIEELSVGEYSSAGTGIMMIILSLICRYGAELNDEKAAKKEPCDEKDTL